jgi:hypothetical protein
VAEAATAKAKAEAEGAEEEKDYLGEEEDEAVAAEAEASPGGVCPSSARVQAGRLRRGVWRVHVVGAAGGGDSPDARLVASALSYEGACFAGVGFWEELSAGMLFGNH